MFDQLYDLGARILGVDVDDAVRLPANPAKGWLVHSLEIILTYRDKQYLLLTHPQYSVYEEISRDNAPHQVLGFWACPYMPLPVAMPPFHSINTLGQARRYMAEAYAKIRQERLHDGLVGNFLFCNGVRHFEYLPDLLEFKASPKSKKSYRLYKIIRMAPDEWDEECIYDLTDPHFLKGNYFIDLEQAGEEARSLGDLRFHGRPLMPNLVHVIKNRRTLRPPGIGKAIATDDSHWVERCEGVLLSIDIRGYEGMMGSLHINSFNPYGPPDQTVDEARRIIISLFCELSRSIGSGQIFFLITPTDPLLLCGSR